MNYLSSLKKVLNHPLNRNKKLSKFDLQNGVTCNALAVKDSKRILAGLKDYLN